MHPEHVVHRCNGLTGSRRTREIIFLACAMSAWCCPAPASVAQAKTTAADRTGAVSALAGLSVPFEANQGQFDTDVSYVARTFAATVFVTRQGQIVYGLGRPPNRAGSAADDATAGPRRWSAVETLERARPLHPHGTQPGTATVAEFHGADPARWQRDIASYTRVNLGEAWRGIEVELAAHGGNVEKLFTVAPDADASSIRMALTGASGLRVSPQGALVATTGIGPLEFTRPVAYQMIDGQQRSVPVQYRLRGAHSYTFALGPHDRSHAVVIDPALQATYLGGEATDIISAMAINATTGDVYVTGRTNSTDFPGRAGGAQASIAPGGDNDLFIARLDAGLTTLKQSTYLGGGSEDDSFGIAINQTTGDVYVAGFTVSTDFPHTTGGAQPSHATEFSPHEDAVVARLSADLKTLDQSTYYGGLSDDSASAIAINGTSGNVYIAGTTISDNLVVAGGAQTSIGSGSQDAFVACFNANLTSLVQATYFGGSGGNEYANALAIDATSGDVFIAGRTQIAAPLDNLPGVAGGAQATFGGGGFDGFIARLNGGLTSISQSTFLGGSSNEQLTALVVDPSTHDVYVTGDTPSTDFPGTSGGAQASYDGSGLGIFISRLNNGLTTLKQSTYLAHDNFNYGIAIALDPASGDVFVAGESASSLFPGVAAGVQSQYAGGSYDAVVARLNPALTVLRQSTYLGGGSSDQSSAIAVHPLNGQVYVAGLTTSADFHGTTAGAQPGPGSIFEGEDGFVVQVIPQLKVGIFADGFEQPAPPPPSSN